MTNVVNLRRVRKAKQRAEAETVAAGNRVRHGRTRGEREQDVLEADRARRLLDGAHLAPNPDRDDS